MPIICVVGTSGAGTSFLVRQLASIKGLPAFLEGEEGTIPLEIFESVFNGEPPQKRCTWFVNKYVRNFENATAISRLGMGCFVDGAPMTVYANIALEDERYLEDLKKIANRVDEFKIDKIILLTVSKNELKEFIAKRGRSEEPIEKTLERSLRLQDELIRISENQSNVITVDRSNLDFTKEKDLKLILEKINEE